MQAVVIGAGVVGLACAARLAQEGFDVLVLESAGAIGTGTSSRNSEVIHAGMYYPQKSLKAQLCVAGRRMLYEYCETHSIGYKRCEKLIVACDEAHLNRVRQLHESGLANGVEGLSLLNGDQARELEPALRCVGALRSEQTGIVVDLAGRAKLGPDVQWLSQNQAQDIDYAVETARSASFYAAVYTYWPDLPDGALTPDYAGIRPKLSAAGETAADFMIDTPREHGLNGLVQLFGIESPGLTASLAIAQYVVTNVC
jgi:L-2-hydroxyglutarate oxidase LhgO